MQIIQHYSITIPVNKFIHHILYIALYVSYILHTFESLNELLVARGHVARSARALHRYVEHRFALHFPARVGQRGEEAVELRVELVANRVRPVALLEEQRREHRLHQTQQVLDLIAGDRSVLHHSVEILGRQLLRLPPLFALLCSCTTSRHITTISIQSYCAV